MDWTSLITPAIIAAVPLIMSVVKKVIPDKAKVAIPVVAVAFGPVLDAVASGLQSQPASPGKGLLLGAAGVALREIVDQAKKTGTSITPFILLPFLIWTATPAEAVGVVVGTNCEAAWSAVTTNTDGSPIVGSVTYNVYLAPGTPATPPATPVQTGITVTTQVKICTTLAPGQYTFWVTAVEVPGTFSSSESAKSPAFPFVLVVPTAPGGVGIK